ncbi:putative fatty acid amide hydrolase [Sesbania bispinosa]|nr:putative fatty acid amide hydrolase [Sesbania bispinosa]
MKTASKVGMAGMVLYFATCIILILALKSIALRVSSVHPLLVVCRVSAIHPRPPRSSLVPYSLHSRHPSQTNFPPPLFSPHCSRLKPPPLFEASIALIVVILCVHMHGCSWDARRRWRLMATPAAPVVELATVGALRWWFVDSRFRVAFGQGWLWLALRVTGRLRLMVTVLVRKTNMHEELGGGTSGVNPHYGRFFRWICRYGVCKVVLCCLGVDGGGI